MPLKKKKTKARVFTIPFALSMIKKNQNSAKIVRALYSPSSSECARLVRVFPSHGIQADHKKGAPPPSHHLALLAPRLLPQLIWCDVSPGPSAQTDRPIIHTDGATHAYTFQHTAQKGRSGRRRESGLWLGLIRIDRCGWGCCFCDTIHQSGGAVAPSATGQQQMALMLDA